MPQPPVHHSPRLRRQSCRAGAARLDALNASALGAALLAALLIVVAAGRRVAPPPPVAATAAQLSADARAVIGGDGVAVPIGAYRRIVSLAPQAEEELAQLGLAARLAAVSEWSAARSRWSPAFAPIAGRIAAGTGAEAILALDPDLALVAAYTDAGLIARLRAAGVPVFHLGAQTGAVDAQRNLRELGALVGEAAAGERAAAAFARRLAHVATPPVLAGVDAGAPRVRPRACVVLLFAGRLAGGTAGTSYADILAAAGADDAAAAAGFRGWPAYTIEQLARIDPEVVVTATGSAAALAALPGAGAVPALADRRIVEIDEDLLDSPGVAILDAAEALADALAARERAP